MRLQLTYLKFHFPPLPTLRRAVCAAFAGRAVNLTAWTSFLGFASVSCFVAQAHAACTPPPPAMHDIHANSYYTDKHHSIVDPVLKAKDRAAVKPLNDYLRAVSRDADHYLAGPDRAAGQCALNWLDAWAKGGAMQGNVSSNQAQYQRKWMLAGLALAYLKLKPEASAAQRDDIEPWLSQLADASLAVYDSAKRSRNNHYYWTGLAAMATGAATGNMKYINAARTIYDAALDDIQEDGSLPLELNRAGKALSYHNYALAPLVLMAQLAHRSGEDWYGRKQARLTKLERRVLTGLADPSWFARKTGVEQEIPKGGILGWVAFPEALSGDLAKLAHPLQHQAPFRYAQLGGNLSMLAERHFFDNH